MEPGTPLLSSHSRFAFPRRIRQAAIPERDGRFWMRWWRTLLECSGPRSNVDVMPDMIVRRWHLWEAVCVNGTVSPLPSVQLLTMVLIRNPITGTETLYDALAPLVPRAARSPSRLHRAQHSPSTGWYCTCFPRNSNSGYSSRSPETPAWLRLSSSTPDITEASPNDHPGSSAYGDRAAHPCRNGA